VPGRGSRGARRHGGHSRRSSLHNLCIAADGAITGVFDVGDAGPDAPETDLQYAHSLGPRFVEIATRAYGGPLDLGAIHDASAWTKWRLPAVLITGGRPYC
jgi:hypothetical protein